MIDRLKFWAPFAAFILLVLIWAGLSMRSCSARHQDTRQMVAADQQHAAAITNAAQGAVHDQEAQALQIQIAKDAALVASLRAQLARVHSAPVQPAPAPGAPDPVDVAPPPDPVLGPDKDALIAAQDQQIQDQAQQILVLTARGDSYKAAWEASAQEASSLRLAHEAALHLAHAERWRGRIEGLVVGLGVGYVGGKL